MPKVFVFVVLLLEHTPGLVCWPGRLEPGDVRVPLHAVDWLPTFSALAGVRLPHDLKLDGMDLWPVLTEREKAIPVRTIYSAAPGFRAQMVRHGDWKLIVTKAGGRRPAGEELFNLVDDVGETKNFVAEKPELLAEMKNRLAHVSASDNDSVARD